MKNWSTTKKIVVLVVALLIIATLLYQFTNVFGNNGGFFSKDSRTKASGKLKGGYCFCKGIGPVKHYGDFNDCKELCDAKRGELGSQVGGGFR